MKNLLIIIILFITTTSIAQTDTVYYDKDRVEGANKASAEYYRVTEKHDSTYLVKEVYIKSGLPQMIAECSSVDPVLVRNGKTTTYWPSGKKKSEGIYVNDKSFGVWILWDEDGKDSLVIDSKVDGTYKNIHVPASQEVNRETNVTYQSEVMPEYPGGMSELYQFIGKNVKYPKKARKSNISGTSYITFVIEKDGKITGVKTMKDFKNCPECDKESIRVIKKMPNWNPGMQFGKVVRVQFNIPIKYTLR